MPMSASGKQDPTSSPAPLLSTQTVADVARQALIGLDEMSDGKRGLLTGFRGLDDTTGGLNPGELIVVGGRPMMGKTSFLLAVADYVATGGAGVVVFSPGTSARAVALHLLGRRAGIERSSVLKATVSEAHRRVLRDQAVLLGDVPLYVNHRAASLSAIRAELSRLCSESDIGLAAVDGMEALREEDETWQARPRIVAAGLKDAATELGIPVLVTSALTRRPERRRNHRPRLSDLPNVAIADCADMVLMLYREAYYSEDHDDQMAEVIVGKNERGSTGTVGLHFERETCRFRDPTVEDLMGDGGAAADTAGQ